MKISYFIVLFLFVYNLVLCDEEFEDFSFEDETNEINKAEEKNETNQDAPSENTEKPSEEVKKEKRVINEKPMNKRRPSFQDDNDEFDDPNLFRKMWEEDMHRQQGINRKNGIHKPQEINPQGQPINSENVDKIVPKETKDKIVYFLIHHYDLLFLFFTVIFILNAFLGKFYNSYLANKWIKNTRKFFDSNYAHLGMEREYNEKARNILSAYSYNRFTLFLSGRVYLNWMTVNIELCKRQDLISVMALPFTSSTDQLVYHASLSPVSDIPVVFGMCRKKDVKSFQKKYTEIGLFTEIYNDFKFLSKSDFVLLSESYDFTNKMFSSNDKLVKAFDKVSKYVDMIIYSDMKTFLKEDNAMMLVFNCKGVLGNLEVTNDINVFVHTIIDVLCNMSVKPGYKREAEAKRRKFESRIKAEMPMRRGLGDVDKDLPPVPKAKKNQKQEQPESESEKESEQSEKEDKEEKEENEDDDSKSEDSS